MAFISSNLSNIESNLSNSIAKLETDSGKKPVALPYQIFASDIYQNYCRNWCDSPGDDVFAEMHDIFFNKCKHVVLKEHGYSSLIPSWVSPSDSCNYDIKFNELGITPIFSYVE